MPDFATHDYCGVLIHECPACKFDDENLATVKAHWWQVHGLPAKLEEDARRRAQATLYAPDGEVVEFIDRGEKEDMNGES
jgi:hypothetical protein